MITAVLSILFTVLLTLQTTDGILVPNSKFAFENLTKKGVVAICLATFLILITCFQYYKSDEDQNNYRKSVKDLEESQRSLIESSILERKIAALRFDSAQTTMMRFKESAEKDRYISYLDRRLRLAEGKNLKLKIDSLERQLVKANQLELLAITEREAELDVCEYVKWYESEGDSLFTLKFDLCNKGDRTAENIKMNIHVLVLDKSTRKIIQKASIDNDFSDYWNLTPDRILIKPLKEKVNLN